MSSALEQLELTREKITYELVENSKVGFLGLGGVKVKLKVFYDGGAGKKTKEFLAGLFELMDVSADISVDEKENGNLDVKLEGEDMGLLIGRRGETLDAIQYIAGLVANKNSENYIRVNIDSENYRAKREGTLVALANRVAEKVLKNQRSMTLEPMSPQERRIIHSALQNKSGVTTFSTGQDPNRRVVIAPATADGKPKTKSRSSHRGHGSKKPAAPAKSEN